MQGNVLGQKKKNKSFDINGIIKEYKVARGGNINAGDFVEFINTFTEKDIQLSTDAKSGYTISAVQLTENRIFIATARGNNYLYGRICTINEQTIETGIDTMLSNWSNTTSLISLIKINDTRVFIAYKGYISIYEIEGVTITKVVDTFYTNWNNVSAVKLDENKIFLSYGYSNYLYSLILTISETGITQGTSVTISQSIIGSSEFKRNKIAIITLTTSKVFICYGSNDNYTKLYGIICSVSGPTISLETNECLDSTSFSGYSVSASKLKDNQVFIVHDYYQSNHGLGGMICTINENTIIVENHTLLNSSGGYLNSSQSKLSDGRIFLAYVDNSSYYLWGMLCNIDGTDVSIESNVQLSSVVNSGYSMSIVALSNTKIFLVHSNSSDYLLYGMLPLDQDNICVKNYSNIINGVAKTSGTENEIVQVYVPNINNN